MCASPSSSAFIPMHRERCGAGGAEPRGHLSGTLSEQGTQPCAEHSRDEHSGCLQKVWPKVASPPPCHRWDLPAGLPQRPWGCTWTPAEHCCTAQPAPESALVGLPPSAAFISGWDQLVPSPFWVRGSSPGFVPQQEPCWEAGRMRALQGSSLPAPHHRPRALVPPCPSGCTDTRRMRWVATEPPVQDHPRPAQVPLSLRRLCLPLHTAAQVVCPAPWEPRTGAFQRHQGAQDSPPQAWTSAIAPRYCQEQLSFPLTHSRRHREI